MSENIFKEDEFVELKTSFCDKVVESLVAFSNFKGGRVIVGIDEKKKKIVGVELREETLKNWQNEIKNKTEPYITHDVYTEKIDGRVVVILEVIEFPIKPVSFKNRYFIRKNNSNHQMSVSEVSEMFLKTKRSSWDYYYWDGVDREDLDDDKIGRAMDMIEKNLNISLGSTDDFLNKYELVDGKKVTNAAMLLFSKKPLRETDMQIGLFQDDITIKKDKVIRTDLISEIDEVMDFIKAYILKEFIITGNPQREERWQYPMDAIRELVINAIIHRDYRGGIHSQFKVFGDKLDFYNHGALPYDLSIEDILDGKKKSEPRNLLIAEIFRDCGLIERYGSGVKRVRDAFKEYKLPDLDISSLGNGFSVIAYSKEYLDKSDDEKTSEPLNEPLDEPLNEPLNEHALRVLKYIKLNPNSKRDDILKNVDISLATLKRDINLLMEKDLIEREGSKKTGGYVIKK